MRVVSSPALAPGACVTCLASIGPFVDTAVSRDGWGRIYLCAVCANDVGLTAGLNVAPDLRAHSALASSHARVVGERDAALAELARVRDAVRTTLQQGGLAARKGEFRLRAPRGKAKVEV